MFKKKSNLPPRPKFPNDSQMVADYSSANAEDPICRIAKVIMERKNITEAWEDQEPVYKELRKLFAMHEDLRIVVKNVDEVKKNLEEKKKDIVRMSDELKEQALKALV